MFSNVIAFLKQPLNSSPIDIFLIIGVVLAGLFLWGLAMSTIGHFERA